MKNFRNFIGVMVALSFVCMGSAFAQHKYVRHHHKTVTKNMTQVVRINSADAVALASLKGIGPRKAQAILAYREQNGSFNSVSDLTKVKGIGQKFLARLQEKNPGKISL